MYGFFSFINLVISSRSSASEKVEWKDQHLLQWDAASTPLRLPEVHKLVWYTTSSKREPVTRYPRIYYLRKCSQEIESRQLSIHYFFFLYRERVFPIRWHLKCLFIFTRCFMTYHKFSKLTWKFSFKKWNEPRWIPILWHWLGRDHTVL